MAEPLMELNASLSSTPTTYDQAIITANVVDTDKVIRWGDPDSADGTITNVTLPSSGDIWAPELWLEDLSAPDVLLVDTDEQPNAATPKAMTFELSSNAVSYATAPRITAWDSNAHSTTTEEIFAGTAGNGNDPLLKARGQTVNSVPPQHWGLTEQGLHDLDGTGPIVCGDASGSEENAVLEGDANYLYASNVDINGNPQYFALALSVPDDATTGVDAIDVVLTIRYTYT
ncbi:MAG: hypothetical protein V3V14_08275 [Saprospiraceae bacterium]